MANNYRTEEVIEIARNSRNHSQEVVEDVAKRYSHVVVNAFTVEGLLAIIAAIPGTISGKQVNKRLAEGTVEDPTIEEVTEETIEDEAPEDTEAATELLKKEKAAAAKAAKKAKDAETKATKEKAMVALDEDADDMGFDTEETEVTVAFKDMDVNQLKAALKERKLSPAKGTSKAAVIKMLEEADTANAPASDEWEL